jgi:hypothetical protein
MFDSRVCRTAEFMVDSRRLSGLWIETGEQSRDSCSPGTKDEAFGSPAHLEEFTEQSRGNLRTLGRHARRIISIPLATAPLEPFDSRTCSSM